MECPPPPSAAGAGAGAAAVVVVPAHWVWLAALLLLAVCALLVAERLLLLRQRSSSSGSGSRGATAAAVEAEMRGGGAGRGGGDDTPARLREVRRQLEEEEEEEEVEAVAGTRELVVGGTAMRAVYRSAAAGGGPGGRGRRGVVLPPLQQMQQQQQQQQQGQQRQRPGIGLYDHDDDGREGVRAPVNTVEEVEVETGGVGRQPEEDGEEEEAEETEGSEDTDPRVRIADAAMREMARRSKRVRLNIGGTTFMTTIATISADPDCYFAGLLRSTEFAAGRAQSVWSGNDFAGLGRRASSAPSTPRFKTRLSAPGDFAGHLQSPRMPAPRSVAAASVAIQTAAQVAADVARAERQPGGDNADEGAPESTTPFASSPAATRRISTRQHSWDATASSTSLPGSATRGASGLGAERGGVGGGRGSSVPNSSRRVLGWDDTVTMSTSGPNTPRGRSRSTTASSGRGSRGDSHRDKEQPEEMFVDRDPTYFRYVLNYLRDGQLNLSWTSDLAFLEELRREAEFYALQHMMYSIQKRTQEVLDETKQQPSTEKEYRLAHIPMAQATEESMDALLETWAGERGYDVEHVVVAGREEHEAVYVYFSKRLSKGDIALFNRLMST